MTLRFAIHGKSRAQNGEFWRVAPSPGLVPQPWCHPLPSPRPPFGAFGLCRLSFSLDRPHVRCVPSLSGLGEDLSERDAVSPTLSAISACFLMLVAIRVSPSKSTILHLREICAIVLLAPQAPYLSRAGATMSINNLRALWCSGNLNAPADPCYCSQCNASFANDAACMRFTHLLALSRMTMGTLSFSESDIPHAWFDHFRYLHCSAAILFRLPHL